MGSLCGEYVFMGPSETSLKTCHGANYLHEPPSGPCFELDTNETPTFSVACELDLNNSEIELGV